jgi:Ni/Co efflux regulator RcnB
MMKKWWVVIIALAFLAMPVFAVAQQATTPSTPPHEHPAGPESKMDKTENSRDWQAKHEKMVADMKAMDIRLDEKVAAMNAAKGDQKVEAMAAVINELVSQRKEMRADFSSMHHGMRSPMMGHAGPMDCPMMKHHGGMQADAPKKEATP